MPVARCAIWRCSPSFPCCWSVAFTDGRCRHSCFLRRKPCILRPADLAGPYELLYVIDGDTLQLRIDGQSKRVRLIGVDAPESAQRDESKNTPEGEAAALFMKELLKGKNVQLYLEYDEQRIDAYGRTLAYVYMDDGEPMLQEALLRAGMAEPLPIAPNDRYSERFEELNADARWERAGLYGGR